jgi:hypothetical protein
MRPRSQLFRPDVTQPETTSAPGIESVFTAGCDTLLGTGILDALVSFTFASSNVTVFNPVESVVKFPTIFADAMLERSNTQKMIANADLFTML